MRAMSGLADTLRDLGRLDESARTYREMLRLNPNDNQGVRDLLAGVLLALGDPAADELRQLLDRYSEDTAMNLYSRAFLAFRASGDSPEARHALTRAIDANPHMVKYLAALRPVPPLPDTYSHGDETEAAVFSRELAPPWQATPGAAQWLIDHIATRAPKPTRRRRPAAPKSPRKKKRGK